MSKPDKPLFAQHEHALQKAYQVCPDCGAELTIKQGKSGAFLGCVKYPDCTYTRAVVEQERVEDKILPGSECPQCKHSLAVKQGRYGMFIGCSHFPDCTYIEQEQVNALVEVACPNCQKGCINEKTSRYGKKFYACDTYPKCKFIVNFEPIEGNCQQCDFPLLLKRNMSAGVKYQCANKKCSAMQT